MKLFTRYLEQPRICIGFLKNQDDEKKIYMEVQQKKGIILALDLNSLLTRQDTATELNSYDTGNLGNFKDIKWQYVLESEVLIFLTQSGEKLLEE